MRLCYVISVIRSVIARQLNSRGVAYVTPVFVQPTAVKLRWTVNSLYFTNQVKFFEDSSRFLRRINRSSCKLSTIVLFCWMRTNHFVSVVLNAGKSCLYGLVWLLLAPHIFKCYYFQRLPNGYILNDPLALENVYV